MRGIATRSPAFGGQKDGHTHKKHGHCHLQSYEDQLAIKAAVCGFVDEQWHLSHNKNASSHSVDGQNPAPPGMVKTP